MTASSAQAPAKIDTLMARASAALVARKYFDAESLSVQALRQAHAIHDYDRMARIILPLQEARRQKRDLAFDAGAVFLMDEQIPEAGQLLPGCYLIAPPRVGADGRAIREIADAKEIPVIVLVREPATRDGLWPIVAVGPATTRIRVPPPRAPIPPDTSAKHVRGKRPVTGGRSNALPGTPEPGVHHDSIAALPSPEWFVSSNEALGDAAIASVSESLGAESRVDALLLRLETLPDHEKLHQRLMEACREAARVPTPRRRAPAPLDPDAD